MKKNKIENATTFTTYLDFIRGKEKDLYQYGRYVANKCLFNKESKTAQRFITEILLHRNEDISAFDVAEKVEKISRLAYELEYAQKMRDFVYQQKNKLTISQAERQGYEEEYQRSKAKAENLQGQIDDISKSLATISTNYSDLVQQALLQHTINNKYGVALTDNLLSAYDANSYNELTVNQIYECFYRMRFKMCCRAVNNYMTAQLSHTSHNSHKSQIKEQLPPEIIEQIENAEKSFIQKVGNITYYKYTNMLISYNGKTYYYDTTTCKFRTATEKTSYYTFEHKNNKTRKGWYNVYHYGTIRNISALESFTNEENEQQDITFLMSAFDRNSQIISKYEKTDYNTARIKLLNYDKFTDRQRVFLQALTSATAEKIRATTRKTFYNTCNNLSTATDKKQASKKALQLEYESALAYAFNKLIEYVQTAENKSEYTMSDSSRRKFLQRIREVIRQYQQADKQPTASKPTANNKPIDRLGWIATDTAPTNTESIQWIDRQQAIISQVTHTLQSCMNCIDSSIDNTTATAQQQAEQAEKAYKAKEQARQQAEQERLKAEYNKSLEQLAITGEAVKPNEKTFEHWRVYRNF